MKINLNNKALWDLTVKEIHVLGEAHEIETYQKMKLEEWALENGHEIGER